MTTNPVIDAALIRAFIISVLLGALSILTTKQVVDSATWEDAMIGGGIAFISALLLRGFGEGGYDARRAATGNVHDSDVPVVSDKHIVTTKKEED